jgi:hypothetical protein
MDFFELLGDMLKLLHQHGRATYRALKRQFHRDDDVLDALKLEAFETQWGI